MSDISLTAVTLSSGTKPGPYVVTGRLGEGGMGPIVPGINHEAQTFDASRLVLRLR